MKGGINITDLPAETDALKSWISQATQADNPELFTKIDALVTRQPILQNDPLYLNRLHHACAQGKKSCVTHLIQHHHDIIDRKEGTSGLTPLMIACAEGKDEIVQLLIDNGADIYLRDNKGFSAFEHIVHIEDQTKKDAINKILENRNNVLVDNYKKEEEMVKSLHKNKEKILTAINSNDLDELKILLVKKPGNELIHDLLKSKIIKETVTSQDGIAKVERFLQCALKLIKKPPTIQEAIKTGKLAELKIALEEIGKLNLNLDERNRPQKRNKQEEGIQKLVNLFEDLLNDFPGDINELLKARNELQTETASLKARNELQTDIYWTKAIDNFIESNPADSKELSTKSGLWKKAIEQQKSDKGAGILKLKKSIKLLEALLEQEAETELDDLLRGKIGKERSHTVLFITSSQTTKMITDITQNDPNELHLLTEVLKNLRIFVARNASKTKELFQKINSEQSTISLEADNFQYNHPLPEDTKTRKNSCTQYLSENCQALMEEGPTSPIFDDQIHDPLIHITFKEDNTTFLKAKLNSGKINKPKQQLLYLKKACESGSTRYATYLLENCFNQEEPSKVLIDSLINCKQIANTNASTGLDVEDSTPKLDELIDKHLKLLVMRWAQEITDDTSLKDFIEQQLVPSKLDINEIKDSQGNNLLQQLANTKDWHSSKDCLQAKINDHGNPTTQSPSLR